MLENPTQKISKSLFYSFRPSHIMLANFASRKTCLCSRHQNMSLKMRALINIGIQCPKNPDDCIEQFETNESITTKIRDVDVDVITFKQWKRVQDGNKFRHKEVEEQLPKDDFIALFDKDLTEFREHVARVQHQYKELRKLRENLPANELVVWMDFAENFQCVSVEEVQSAYCNAPAISLHTMVIYFPSGMEKSI